MIDIRHYVASMDQRNILFTVDAENKTDDEIQKIVDRCFQHPSTTDAAEAEIQIRGDKCRLIVKDKCEDIDLSKVKQTLQGLKVEKRNDVKPLLERFSKITQDPGTTLWGKLQKILAWFFKPIIEIFERFESIDQQLHPKEVRSMPWDLDVLEELSGEGKMSLSSTLQYLIKVTEGSQEEKIEVDRMKKALAIAQKLEKNKGKIQPREFVKLRDAIRKEINKLQDGEKFLLPAGFGDEQVLMELEKKGGKLEVSLIGLSEGSRDLFDKRIKDDKIRLSQRRTMVNVDPEEFKVRILTFLELQATTDYKKEDLKRVFLKALHFTGSKIKYSEAEEKVIANKSRGHLEELMLHLKESKKGDEGEKVNLAIRLRMFLEICDRSPHFFTDVEARKLTLKVATELASSLEGSPLLKDHELQEIYQKLIAVIDKIEKTPAKTFALESAKLPEAGGRISGGNVPPTPYLTRTTNLGDEVFIELPSFNPKDPSATLTKWGFQIHNLVNDGDYRQAAHMAKLMAKELPNLDTIDPEKIKKRQEVQVALNWIVDGIVRNTLDRKEHTNLDVLSCIAFAKFAIQITPEDKRPKSLVEALGKFDQIIGVDDQEEHWLTYSPTTGENPVPESQHLLSMSMVPFLVVNPGGVALDNLPENKPITFELSGNRVVLRKGEPRSFIDKLLDILLDRHIWAHKIDKPPRITSTTRNVVMEGAIHTEIAERYLTVQCALGCTGDLCPNYNNPNMFTREEHRIYPVYQAHHFIEDYCKSLLKEGWLTRDEAQQLLYTQQTQIHGGTLGIDHRVPYNFHNTFEKADRFTDQDRGIQLMNAIGIYLRNPHFFQLKGTREHLLNKVALFQRDFSDESYKTFREEANDVLVKLQLQFAQAGEVDAMAAVMTLQAKLGEDGSLIEMAFETLQEYVKKPKERDRYFLGTISGLVLQELGKKELSDFLTTEPDFIQFFQLWGLYCENKDNLVLSSNADEQIQMLGARVLGKFKKEIKKDRYSDVTNEILLVVDRNLASQALEWDADEYPLMRAFDHEGKDVNFDLFTGKVSGTSSLLSGSLSGWVASRPLVRGIFGDAIRERWDEKSTSKDSGYRIAGYTHKKFPGYRIVHKRPSRLYKGSQQVIIERQLKDQKGERNWFALVGFPWQEREAEKVEVNIPDSIKAAIGNKIAFMDRAGTTIHLYDESGEEQFGTINLKDGEITSVVLKGTDRRVLDPSDKQLQRFSSIEDPEKVQVWGEKGKADQVEYIRLVLEKNGEPLSFVRKGKNWMCSQFPKMTLAELGERPTKGIPSTFERFALLTDNGLEQVLVPMVEFAPQAGSTGEPGQTTKAVTSTEDTLPVFQYKYDPETERLDGEGRPMAYAYMAYVSLAHRDYEAASYYLSKAKTITGYTQEHNKILEWAQKYDDNSPNGRISKLRFILFQMRVLKEQGKDEFPLPQLAELYYRISTEGGEDPLLSLSAQEHAEAKRWIETMLANNGDSTISETAEKIDEATDIRYQYLSPEDKVSKLDILEGAMVLYHHKKKKSARGMLSLEDPIWIANDFIQIAKEIGKAQGSPEQLKELEYKILLSDQLPKNHLTSQEKIAVQKACYYLLRLIQDPTAAETIGKLSLGKAAPKIVSALRTEIPYSEGDLNKCIKKIGKIDTRLARKVKNAVAKRSPTQDISDAYRDAVIEAVGGKQLRALNDELLALTGTPVKRIQPKSEHLQPAPLSPDETYNDRYASLIEIPEVSKEQPIHPSKEEPVTFPDRTGFTPVVVLDGYSQFFGYKDGVMPQAKTTVFDRLQKSGKPELERHAKEHEEDYKAALKPKRDVTKFDKSDIISKLDTDSKAIKQSKENLRTKLEEFVDRFEVGKGRLAMQRLVGKRGRLTLDRLIGLYAAHELTVDTFKGLGVKLTLAELKVIEDDIQQYLEVSVKDRLITRIFEEVGKKRPSEEIIDLLETARNYPVGDKFRELLYLEYKEGIVLREPQIATLETMINDPDAVCQLPMGAGKSTVLLPLLAKKKANGKNLVSVLLPDALFVANCNDLDQTNRELFGQEMYRFTFSRSEKITKEYLSEIRENLERIIREQGYVMTTKKNVLSFRNAYVDLLLNAQENQEVEGPEIASMFGEQEEEDWELALQMGEILRIFETQGDALSDEVHECLDIRKEVNFTKGGATHISKVKRDAAADVMAILLESPKLSNLRDILFNNQQSDLSDEVRLEHLKGLVEAYYDAKVTNITPAVEKKHFVEYILNLNDSGKGENASIGEKWMAKLEGEKVTIQAVKGFFNSGICLSLKAANQEHYGRDPKTHQKTIPYKGLNAPSIGSEHDEDMEKLAYTYQDYLQNGVSFEQIFNYVARKRSDALKEFEGGEGSIVDSAENEKFSEIMNRIDPKGKLKLLSLSALDSPAKIQDLVNVINKDPSLRVGFCRALVAPAIEKYDTQIHAGSFDLPEIFRHFSGFTGTPWNMNSYHPKIHPKKTKGVDGITWATLLHGDSKVKVIDVDSKATMESIVGEMPGHNALIDVGGYLRGCDNNQFVDKLLENGAAEAGIYFDKGGNIVKKIGADGKPLPIARSARTSLEENFTLYDQTRAVGTNLPQAPQARAWLTNGKNTPFWFTAQGAWRMRGLSKGQGVDFLQDRALLANPNQVLTIEDILEGNVQNEAAKETVDNFRGYKEYLMGMAKREALKKAVACKTVGELKNLPSETFSLLVKRKSDEADFKRYGKVQKISKAEKEIQRLQKKAGKKLGAIGVEDPKFVDKKLDLFPQEVIGTTEGAEVEVEAEVEMEQEAELALETETETEVEEDIEMRTIVQEKIVSQKKIGGGSSGHCSPISNYDLYDINSECHPLTSVAGLFDRLYCTTIFERDMKPGVRPEAIFYTDRKFVMQLFVKIDNTGKAVGVIPSTHEAHEACLEYAQIAANSNSTVVFIQNGKPITMAGKIEDEHKDAFYETYVQAKFFGGEVKYDSAEEKAALERWLDTSAKRRQAKELFEKYILPSKPARYRDHWIESPLKAALEKA